MRRTVSLFVVLLAVWLLFSGHFEALTIILGILSCALVVALTHRMDVIDHEGHPAHLGISALRYWAWLSVEITRANIDVARRIVTLSLPIDPCLIRLKPSQKTAVGRVTYANSITLTPGTVAMLMESDEVLVHALDAGSAGDLATGEMDRRVAAMEGRD